tara:strand:+ start:183 stop:362 length:180 start_codon:yes stop_codon:yes gene_type:complete
MITIPDAIAKLRMILKRTIDIPLSWMEHIGSKMNVYAWQKRWGNRKQGTGYRQPDDDCQ